MNRAVFLCLMLATLLPAMLEFSGEEYQAGASATIFIRADGSVDPSTAPITRSNDTTYILTDNINAQIGIQRSDITVNGNGFGLQGSESGTGFSLSEVNNVTIRKTSIKGFRYGVFLAFSFDCALFENGITDNGYGVFLSNCWNTAVSKNNVSCNTLGIFSVGSVGSIFSENSVAKNLEYGIHLESSATERLSYNNVTDNQFGIWMYYCSFNDLHGNMIRDNKYNFGVGVDELQQASVHSIDESNTVNGKPVYYLVNRSDLVVEPSSYPKIGYMALVKCVNVTVRNLVFTDNSQGLLVAHSTAPKIVNNTFADNDCGVDVFCSDYSVFSGNIVESNNRGVRYAISHSGALSGNNITNNMQGICFEWSRANTVCENNILNNGIYGLGLYSCKGRGCLLNRIYHNNFVGNGNHTNVVVCAGTTVKYTNFWDNEGEGNYWSTYAGCDADCDGIGDISCCLAQYNQDNYPLMGRFCSLITSMGRPFVFVSNSTMVDFTFSESAREISIRVSNATAEQTHGFCRLAIQHDSLPPIYSVTINNSAVPYTTIFENGSLSIVCFSYEHSTVDIVIVPEASSSLLMALLMATFLTVALTSRRKRAV